MGAAARGASGLATPSSQLAQCSAFGTLVHLDPPASRSPPRLRHHPALPAYFTVLAPVSAAQPLLQPCPGAVHQAGSFHLQPGAARSLGASRNAPRGFQWWNCCLSDFWEAAALCLCRQIRRAFTFSVSHVHVIICLCHFMYAVKIFAVVNSAQAEIAFHRRLHAMRLSLRDLLIVTLLLLWLSV